MTLGEWQRFMIKQLSKLYSAGEAKSIIRILFEDVSKISSIEFLLKANTEVDAITNDQFEPLLKRLLQHEPVQYVTGIAHFYGLQLKVNPYVLIPRPETEELVKWILLDLKDNTESEPASIIDIGTGSGCIAIALKKNLANSIIFALDVSNDALVTAKENAVANNADINFFKADILTINTTQIKERYDIIVSNPPYITLREEYTLLPNVLKYEPHLALFTKDNDALLFYKAISQFACAMLKPNGRLYFEINELHGADVKQLLEQSSFRDVVIRKDINGKERLVRCSAPLT